MSYILDALKKSEQERGHGNIPDVQTIHSSSLNYRNDKNTYWPYILIIAVILNLVAIVYFMTSKESTSVTPESINQTATQKPEAAADSVNKAAVNYEKTSATHSSEAANNIQNSDATTINNEAMSVDEETLVNKPPVTAETSTKTSTSSGNTADKNTGKSRQLEQYPVEKKPVETKPITQNNTIVEYYELPESIKQQLPAIIISAHVYSSNPLQRSIVINNNFMEEGEFVLDDLMLYEITPDGATFNFQGTLFNYGNVSGWQ